VRVAGTPVDRVAEGVGLLLEQQELKNIEPGKTTFDPENLVSQEQSIEDGTGVA
jgi:hypothetical protein